MDKNEFEFEELKDKGSTLSVHTGDPIAIKEMQKSLNDWGYTDAFGRKLSEDGDFGINTFNSVIKFQQENGLVPDGIVGDKTWKAMSDRKKKEEGENYNNFQDTVEEEPALQNDAEFSDNVDSPLKHGAFATIDKAIETSPVRTGGNKLTETDFTKDEEDFESLKEKGSELSVHTGSPETIKVLQKELNSMGYTDALGRPLSEDGDFGINTFNSVIKFQQENGLAPDGIVGDKTWKAISDKRKLVKNYENQDNLSKNSYAGSSLGDVRNNGVFRTMDNAFNSQAFKDFYDGHEFYSTEHLAVEKNNTKDTSSINEINPQNEQKFEEDANWLEKFIQEAFRVEEEAEKTRQETVDILQKEAQRAFWKYGAENYLKEEKKYYVSAHMLEHSLQDNPTAMLCGNESDIAKLIKKDPVYLNALDKAIANSDGNTIDVDLEDIAFKDKDLYYSIHRATIHVKGYKNKDGKWIINGTLEDTYDFTEMQTFMDDEGGWSTQASLGTVANDAAAVSQFLGAINPYKIKVYFNTVR